jgi:hypothetical protein
MNSRETGAKILEASSGNGKSNNKIRLSLCCLNTLITADLCASIYIHCDR